jgi:RNA polymerase sigma-70 factor (ECF subfamily)
MEAQTLEHPVAHPGLDARFGELLERYRAAIARLARTYEGNRADREDLVQDIWLAVWRALPGFRGDCSERTFVYRIAHNRAITHAGRRRPPAATLDEAFDVSDPRASTEQSVHLLAEQERLLAAVRQLSLTRREVVLLTLEGLPQREIAQVLGITEANVAVRLSRARAELCRLLGDDR